MLRWLTGVKLRDRKPSEEVRKLAGVKREVVEVVRRQRLRWLGHVVRRTEDEPIRKALETVVDGNQPIGRPRKRWLEGVKKDAEKLAVKLEKAQDRRYWRAALRRGADPEQGQGGTVRRNKLFFEKN